MVLLSMPNSPVQAASSQLASGVQLTSCTAWRQGAASQAVQIPKQTPEGSRWDLLDSPEHTDPSQLASWKPLLPLAGPGDVVLPPRLIWILKWRSEGSSQRPQDWNLSSVPPEQAASCVLPDCLRVHTRSPALPGDRVLWSRLFRS